MRQASHHPARGQRRGAVSIYFSVCLVALLSVVALVFDGGRLLEERRHAQATADAAAMSAACDLYDWYWTNSGADPSGTAKASALKTAAANGYANDGTRSVVTVHIPPISGYYEGKRGYVEVLVEYHVPRSFSNIFSKGDVVVRARSVALGAPIAADVGILVLDPSKRSAFNANGSGVTTVSGTPIIVNSSSQEGSIAGGGGTVKADKFVLTGNYSTTGGGQFIGPIYTGRPPTLDPFIDLPIPNPNTMV